MKMFNKVLAVVLSLVMLLSVVPAAVFASEPGSTNGAVSTPGSSATPQAVPVLPAPKGNGSDGTVTLTLSASALVDALTGEKTLDALEALLRDAIDRTNPQAINKSTLLNMIPARDIVDALVSHVDDVTLSNVMKDVLNCVEKAELIKFAEKIANAGTALDRNALAEEIKKLANGDVEALKSYLNSGIDTTKYTADVNAAYAILSSAEGIKDLNLGKLMADIEISSIIVVEDLTKSNYEELIELVGVRNLLSIFKNNAYDLVSKAQLKEVAEILIYHALNNIDLLQINGYNVAVEDPETGWFTMNLDGTIRAIASLIPRLTEIAEDPQGKILAFNTYLDYVDVNGNACNLDVNIEVAVDGGEYDLSRFRDLIAKLADYVAIYNDGNQLYIEFTMPGVVTRAYAKFLESDKGDSIKDEILVLADKTGAELVAALEKLTLNDLLTLLKKVDVEYVYNYITNVSYVETVLNIINTKLGLNYDLEDIQDLNKILDEIADGAPNFTIQKICDKMTEIVKIDVMKYLKKATSFVESNNTIEYYLTKLEKAPYVGEYVKKFNDKDLNELLETYKDKDPIEAISDFVANRVDLDIQYVLQHNDANEIYQLVLNKAADYEYYYNKVKGYVLAALDPDYTANTKWGKLIQKLISDRALNKFLNNSISDYYKGNGEFAGSASSIKLNPAALSETVLNFITKYVNISDEYMKIIENFLPDTTEFEFGINLSVTFQNLAGVTFMDANGNKLLTTFLPYGLNPADYYTTGNDFSFWINKETGEAVTSLKGDVVLIPVNGLFGGATLDKIDENGNWFLSTETESFNVTIDLTNPQNNPIVADLIEKLIKEAKSLSITNSKGLTMKLGEKTLDQMIDLALDNEKRFVVSYAPNANPGKTAWNFTADAFSYVPNRIEAFDLVVAGVAKADMPLFEDDFSITVPFVKAANATAGVYVLTNGVPEKITCTATDKNVVFNVAHFSDYIIVNEYVLSTTFTKGGQTLNAAKPEINVPAGAVVTIAPVLDAAVRAGNRIASINNGALTLGGTMTMPAAPFALNCEVAELNGVVYYNVFGKLFTDVTAATVALNAATVEAGNMFILDTQNNRTWVETQKGTDIYNDPAVKAIEITIVYGTAQDTVTYTLGNFSVKEIPVSGNEGYDNAWKLYTDAAFTTAAAELNNALFTDANDGATFYAKLEQTARKYSVYNENGDKLGEAAFGTTYTYNETKNGYTLKATYVNIKDGSVINATNNAITMPASDVKVIVAYEANDITYTVNGESRTGKYGDIISIEIPVASNQALTTAPQGGKLSSFNKETNTFVYTFELVSALAINYVVETISTDLGLTAPEKDAINRTGMIVALIILAVLAILIALIAIFYNLYINEKLKPNPVLRFITWIVSMFFNVCMALSSLVLVVVQGTAKKGEVNYEEFGMTNPEDMENAEEATEEATEETTEEATEEATEEVTEEVTETAEEAVVEESAAETEVVEEKTAEEAVEAEEAAEEVTEEATEEVTEEAAEEVTEEATETADESEKQD